MRQKISLTEKTYKYFLFRSRPSLVDAILPDSQPFLVYVRNLMSETFGPRLNRLLYSRLAKDGRMKSALNADK